MNPEEYIKREQAFYKKLFTGSTGGTMTGKSKPFETTVYNIVALQAVRIFEKGLKSDGTKIGTYNTTSELYANPVNYKGGGKFKPLKGKTGKSKFKNGSPHKTRYFKNYKELRKTLDRKTDYVNLQLNYDLFSDWANAPKGNFPKKITPKKINNFNYEMRFSRNINALKREGLEDKYGVIFNSTKEERREFIKSLDFNIRKARYNFYIEYGKPTTEKPPQTL